MARHGPHHRRWSGPQDEDVWRTTLVRHAPQGYKKILYQIEYFTCKFVLSQYIRRGRVPLEDNSTQHISYHQYNQTQDVCITPSRRPNLDKILVCVLCHHLICSLCTRLPIIYYLGHTLRLSTIFRRQQSSARRSTRHD